METLNIKKSILKWNNVTFIADISEDSLPVIYTSESMVSLPNVQYVLMFGKNVSETFNDNNSGPRPLSL